MGVPSSLHLACAPQLTERDKVEGVWYAYHAVGGAITLLQTSVQAAGA